MAMTSTVMTVAAALTLANMSAPSRLAQGFLSRRPGGGPPSGLGGGPSRGGAAPPSTPPGGGGGKGRGGSGGGGCYVSVYVYMFGFRSVLTCPLVSLSRG